MSKLEEQNKIYRAALRKIVESEEAGNSEWTKNMRHGWRTAHQKFAAFAQSALNRAEQVK